MKLNFDKLNNLTATAPAEETEKKRAYTSPGKPLLESKPYTDTKADKKGVQSHTDNYNTPAPKQPQKTAENALNRDAYSVYQRNIRASSQLQTEITKGLEAGEDIYLLFLKATRAIANMTGNEAYYTQTKQSLISIYGEALKEQTPLKLELKNARDRLTKLERAESGTAEADTRERIARAVKAHKKKIETLKQGVKTTEELPA